MTNKPLTNEELVRTILFGIGALMLSCSALWLAAFAIGLIK